MVTVKGMPKRAAAVCTLILCLTGSNACAKGFVNEIIQHIGELDTYIALKAGFSTIRTEIILDDEKKTLEGSAPNFSFHIGYRAYKNLRFEVSYAIFADIENSIHDYEIDFGLGGGWEPLEVKINQEASIAALSVFYDFDMEGNVKPYLGANIGYIINTGTIKLIAPVSGITVSEEIPTKVNLTYGVTVGARYDIGRGFTLDGALSYMYAKYDEGQTIFSGQFGINYAF